MSLKKIFEFRESRDVAKPFLDHLEDLRFMIIKIVIVLVVAMVGCFFFRSTMTEFLQHPLLAADPAKGGELRAQGVTDSFTITMELSFYAGIVISCPFLLFFIAEFIMPALTPREKKMVVPVAIAGLGLFICGAAFAYFGVLPRVLEFCYSDQKSLHWSSFWTVREYYSFASQLVVCFGLVFELPILVLALVALGIVNYELMARTRSFAIVVILVLAAVLAPPELMSWALMAVPMYLLYEFCIWIAWFWEKKKRRISNS